jgi:hypothetical protein
MFVAERRRAPRIPISVQLKQHIEGQSLDCNLSDLSTTGLYMERPITSFVRSSAAIELEIPLPDGEHQPVWARAEIVYDCFDGSFHGTAVRFAGMSERDRVRIMAFVAVSTADVSGTAH